jgi:hypothetical protein
MLPIESAQCNDTMIGSCGERTIFHDHSSKSYATVGIQQASMFPDILSLLGNESAAKVGIDNVIFGNIALQSISKARQYIYGSISRQLSVGVFGLAAGSISQSGEALPTLLYAMASARAIPSNSFSYTAGSIKSISPLSTRRYF